MRPDEHRRKKNDAYKKKHNIPTQKVQTKKGGAKSKLESNADRYADTDGLSTQPTGKNLKELLDTAHNVQVTSMKAHDDETGQSARMLSLDTSSIADVIGCFPLADLLCLGPDTLIEAELKNVSGETERRFSDYVENQMDTVYTVDHEVTRSLTREEIVYNNCGQFKVTQKEENERNSDSGLTMVNSVKEADVSAEGNKEAEEGNKETEEDAGEAELEDWLDAMLDD